MQLMNGSSDYLKLTVNNKKVGIEILCDIDKNLTCEEIIEFYESIVIQCNKSSNMASTILSIKSSSRNEVLSQKEPIYQKFKNSTSECFEILEQSSLLDTELQQFQIKVRQTDNKKWHVIYVSRHDTLQQVSEQIQKQIIKRQRLLEFIIKGNIYDPQKNNKSLAALFIVQNDEIQFQIKNFKVRLIDGQRENILQVEFGENRTLLDIQEEIMNANSYDKGGLQLVFERVDKAHKGNRLEITLSQLNIHANDEITAKVRWAGGYQK